MVDVQTINKMLANREEVRLPHGDCILTDTILYPGGFGGAIYGAGLAFENQTETSPLNRGSTRFIWAGPDDGRPMVKMLGQYQRFENATLMGSERKSTNRVVIGLHVARENASVGHGQHFIQNVLAIKCQTSLQLGTNPADGNCDLCTINNWHTRLCDVGVRFKNAQGIGHVFNSFISHTPGIQFLLEAGGHLTINQSTITHAGPGTFLHFSNAAPRKYRIGTGAGMITVNGLKVDSSNGPNFRLVDCDDWTGSGPDIMFRDGQVSYTNYGDNKFIRFGGPGRIKFENFDRKPKLTSQTVETWADPPTSKNPQGRSPVIIDGYNIVQI